MASAALSLSCVGNVDRDRPEDTRVRVHAGLDQVAVVAQLVGVRLAAEAQALVGLGARLRVLRSTLKKLFEDFKEIMNVTKNRPF